MIEVNYVAILIAAVASMAVGFLWYNPILFGKAWMKEKGYSAEELKREQKKMGKYYGISFVLALLTAYILNHVMVLSENFFHYSMLSTGLNTAFWMWLGFVMPVQAADQIFGEKKWKLWGINTGYQLAALLVMGLIIGWMM